MFDKFNAITSTIFILIKQRNIIIWGTYYIID